MYYIYMLRCEDNSIYTGITTDLSRRMEEHFSKNEKCAKYTFRHQAVKLETAWKTTDRKLASKLEYHIKKLVKAKKEILVEHKNKLSNVFGEEIQVSKYKRVGKKEIGEIQKCHVI